MPIPQHLRRQFREVLGQEAAEDLVSWMEGVDNLRADVAELRTELQVLSARMDARFASVDGRLAAIDQRFVTLEKGIEATIERRFADLLKWSFGFWIGAVVAIAVLAKLIR